MNEFADPKKCNGRTNIQGWKMMQMLLASRPDIEAEVDFEDLFEEI
jgi:hypothetical protein